jgi:murein DD-endopeptidase MepM/ murein hydrolase activator NlpD
MVIKQSSKNIYRLPFGKTESPIPKPAPYHQENKWLKYALDFAMPEGTPVLAAAKGKVYLVVDKYKKGGPDKSLAHLCNRIIIKCDNEEYTDYVHLMKGCKVKKGDYVKSGQVIGYSGSTGYVTYPHLHFSVMKRDSPGSWRTIVPRFKIGDKIVTLQLPKG